MKLRAPSRLKVLEALSAIVDARIKLVGSSKAVIKGSAGSREYDVHWNPINNTVQSTDSTTKDGKFGYPVIAFLMLQGVLPYDEHLASKLSEINWKNLCERYDDDEVIINGVLKNWGPKDKQRLSRYTKWILDMLSELDIYFENPTPTLTDFT
ncbi:MAG: hypothetical protein GOV01_01745 [Candidatus Altiarchaeota archaeon]|nr:hypothetical protein [Candidatus Altiarchaeota archaeon]